MVEFTTRTGNEVETSIKKLPAVITTELNQVSVKRTNSFIKFNPPDNIVEFTTRVSHRGDTLTKDLYGIDLRKESKSWSIVVGVMCLYGTVSG